MLLVRQEDRPGIIAAVSGILGEADINISFMTVSRSAQVLPPRHTHTHAHTHLRIHRFARAPEHTRPAACTPSLAAERSRPVSISLESPRSLFT